MRSGHEGGNNMTENGAAAKRASTRSTRASAVHQERKQLLEAAQALPLAPEAAPVSTSSAIAKPNSAVSTPPTTETTAPVAEESTETTQQTAEAVTDTQSSGRRSGRRSAHVTPAIGAAASEETGGETSTTTETTTQEISASEGLSALASANADAVAEFVTNGGSLTAAATRFGLSRAEVTKIVKETTVNTSSAKDGGSEGSPETMKDSDNTTEKTVSSEPAKNDAAPSEQAKNDDASSQGAAVATAAATAAVLSIPTTTATAAPTTFTSLLESNDLKRGSSAMNEAGADAAGLVPKAKRVRKTREEKLAILAFVDDGGTHVAAAEKFGVSRTAVTKMVKERDIILSGPPGKPGIVIGVPTGAPASAPAAPVVRPPPTSTSAAPQLAEAAPIPPPRKTRAMNTSAVKPQSAGTPTSGNPKAKRVRKTNEEKLLILEFVERGGSQGAAAEKFGVSRTAVTKMVKEKEAITAQVMSGKSNHRKVLQYQHKLSIIEDMLYKWQVQVESDAPNLKVTGDLLQSKAVEFRDKILAEWKNSLEPEVVHSLSEFKASNGWLHRYLQRRNLRTASKREYHRRVGPTGGAVAVNSSDPFNISMFLDDVSIRLKAVPVHCIWNMDEIALLTRTLTAPPIPAEGALPESVPAGRMTVSLLVNAAGEKFKPQVLIAEPNMERVEALQKAHPELYIASQQYAWQDTTSLALYLHTVSAEAKKRMETWSIVMDSSPSHIEFAQLVDPSGSFERGYRFEDLVLILLPPQSTPTNQPLHHGVARVFKAAFRQSMLSDLADKLTRSESPSQFDLQTQITDADEVSWVARAWDVTPTTLVRHCWVRNGLLSGPQLAQISQDNSRASEAEHFRALCDTVKALREERDGLLAQTLGLAVPSGEQSEAARSESILDQVNALISLEDHELTERKHVMLVTETDSNGELRVLV